MAEIATAGQQGNAFVAELEASNLHPLWDRYQRITPIKPAPKDAPFHWRWRDIEPFLHRSVGEVSINDIERRALIMAHPAFAADTTTTSTLLAAFTVLEPGDRARPHRHTGAAIRFATRADGAATIVNGRRCEMKEGDLILTPAWTWHEHVHQGSGPIIWLDALDVPFQQYMGTGAFQPGPVAEMPETVADAAFAVANVVPDTSYATREYSPVFRYPYASTAAAVAAAPRARDGSRRVRYVNPLTGGPGMAMMDCFLVQFDPGASTLPFRTTANSVCCVVEGSGESQVGNETIRWRKRDIFTLPQGNRIVHQAAGGPARLFQVSDRDMYARLGLLKEEYGNIAA